MKQGTGNNSASGQKREPISRAISPAAVSEIGIKQVHTGPAPSLVEGRGYKAPLGTSSTHKCGSQGRH